MTYDEIVAQFAARGKYNPFQYNSDQMARDLGFSGTARTITGYGGSPSESTGQGTEAIYDLTPDFEQFLKGYSYEPATSGGRNAALDIRNESGQMVQDDYRVGDHKGSMMKFMGAAVPALVAGGFGAGIGGLMGYGPMAGGAGSGSGIGGATGVDSLAALTQAEVNAAALGPSGKLLGSYGAGAGAGSSFNSMLNSSLSDMGVTNTGAGGFEGGIGPASGVDSLGSLTQAQVNGAALGPSGSLPGLSGGGLPWGQIGKTAGGQLLSAGTQMYGANQAAGAMRDATNQANQLNAPAVAARNSALEQMQALLKDPSTITKQPGYQFGMDQGTKSLNSGAAARGQTYSGGQAKALTKFGQDYAGTKLDQSFNRLSQLASGGQSGTSQTVDNITNQGNANAMPWIVGSNAVADGINGLTAYGNRKNWWGG